jgi:hypothetical protein
MFSNNAKCNKTYIGSTTGSLRARLASHKYARHPIFTFGDADVRVLEKDIPAGELHQRKSAYMREKCDGLFNSRVAGRSQKHACHENVDESPAYSRAQYTPKRDGGDGNYRQLNYYKQHAKRILPQECSSTWHAAFEAQSRQVSIYGRRVAWLGLTTSLTRLALKKSYMRHINVDVRFYHVGVPQLKKKFIFITLTTLFSKKILSLK